MQLQRLGKAPFNNPSPIREIFGRSLVNGKIVVPLDVCLRDLVGGVEVSQLGRPINCFSGFPISNIAGTIDNGYDWPAVNSNAVISALRVSTAVPVATMPSAQTPPPPALVVNDILRLEEIRPLAGGNWGSLNTGMFIQLLTTVPTPEAFPAPGFTTLAYRAATGGALQPTHTGLRVFHQNTGVLLGMLIVEQTNAAFCLVAPIGGV